MDTRANPNPDTLPDWHAKLWQEAEIRAAESAAQDRLYDAVDAAHSAARRASARAGERSREARRKPTRENIARADRAKTAATKAWAAYNAVKPPRSCDYLGRPVDTTRAGRAKYEAAYEQATGHYWGWPWIDEDESRDSNPDHIAGLHTDKPDDTPGGCHDCLADLGWLMRGGAPGDMSMHLVIRNHKLTHTNRKEPRT